MNVTNRKDALRDQRAKMLAAAPDWRASDARVNPRVAIGSIVAMWVLYFLVTTGLAMLTGASEQWSYAGRRAIVVVAGILCTFVLYQLLQRAQPRSFGARLAAAMGAAVPLVVLYASINLIVFFYWFPGPDTAKIIEEVQSKFPVAWEMVLILDSSIRWYFFFAVWAALYVAFGYANEMRAVERRANHFRMEAQTAQLRALHYQVNPHFLFNTLNSLSTLVLEKRSAESEQMIERLSAFLRTALEDDPADEVTLATEIANQRLYLEIEQARFPELAVEFDIEASVERALVPSFLLQPLVENAIKYGRPSSRRKASLSIKACTRWERLELSVTNDVPETRVAHGTGLGLSNVRERLRLRYGKDFTFAAGPGPGGRFEVRLSLPLKLRLEHGRKG